MTQNKWTRIKLENKENQERQEKPIPHQWKMWDLWAAAIVKNEETLRQNLHSQYVFVMSLCAATMEDKVMTHEDYPSIKQTRDTLKQLQVIKQYIYSNGSEELYTVNNKVMPQSTCFGCEKTVDFLYRTSGTGLLQ